MLWFKSKFERIFEFRPEGLDMEQGMVNDLLTFWARLFHEAVQKESNVRHGRSPAHKEGETDQDYHRRAVEELCDAEDLIWHYKRVFWRAHGVAKKEGFLVRERYTDYVF